MTDSLAWPRGRRAALWVILFETSREVTGVGVLSPLLLSVAATLGSGSRGNVCGCGMDRP